MWAISIQIAIYEFTSKLLRELSGQTENADLFFSPSSVAVALGQCVSPEIEDDLSSKVFGQANKNEIQNWIESIVNLKEKSDQSCKLRFVNVLYLDEKFKLQDSYMNLLVEKFTSTELSQGDSKTQANAAVDEINNYFATTTDQQVLNLVPQGAIAPNDLLLACTLFFKGLWEDIFFDENKIRFQDFSLEIDKKIEINMMEGTALRNWFEDENVQVLELQCHKKLASMIIILPKEVDGLKKVIGQLNGQTLNQWINGMEEKDVRMVIPKFNIEQSFPLADTLKRLGFEKAFGTEVDFSKMIQKSADQLHLSNIYHKAVIKVDEIGISINRPDKLDIRNRPQYWPDSEPAEFVADHPFLFLVTAGEENNKTILFAGQFYGKGAQFRS